MGTNYYLFSDACDKCQRGDGPLHIGKSSAGWCFSLHVIPDEGIMDLPDWVVRWSAPNVIIKDEYGGVVSGDEMLLVITARHWDRTDKSFVGYRDEADFHRQNHSMNGPNGLLRHAGCFKHGDGTWDCIEGEFS